MKGLAGVMAAACVGTLTVIAAQQPVRDLPIPRASAPANVGPSGTAGISGAVASDETDSRPLRRAVVTVSGSSLRPARVAITDDAGRFAFLGLPAGNLTLEVVKPGYVSTRYGQKRPGRGAGVVLSLSAGQQMNELVVRMPRGSAITGTITDEAGRPRRNVQVAVLESRVVNGARRLTTVASSVTGEFVRPVSDDRGVFRAYGLPPGDYVVSASLSGIGDLGPSLDLRRANPDELRWATDQLRGPGAPAGTVPGTVAPAGSEPGPSAGQRVGLVPIYYPGTTDASAAVPITLGRGEERQGVDLVIGFVPAARVEGRVVGPDGQPVGGIQLIARRTGLAIDAGLPFSASSGRSGGDGTFSIGNLAPGAYTVVARSTSGRGAGPATGLWASAEIAVDGQDASGLTLSLQPGLTLAGRLVFDGAPGQPIPDMKSNPVRINLRAVTDGLPPVGPPVTRMDADGTFVISGISPGRYRLTAGEQGGPEDATEAARDRWVLRSATLDGLGGRDIADLPIEVAAMNLSGAVVTLTRRLADVSGTLFDAAGRPAPDYFVVVFSTNRDHWLEGSRRLPAPVRPSTNGTYRFAALPAGTYHLAALTDVDREELFDRAFLEQVAAGALTITLGDGEAKVQDIKLAGQTGR
jgi:hypothetical protein